MMDGVIHLGLFCAALLFLVVCVIPLLVGLAQLAFYIMAIHGWALWLKVKE